VILKPMGGRARSSPSSASLVLATTLTCAWYVLVLACKSGFSGVSRVSRLLRVSRVSLFLLERRLPFSGLCLLNRNVVVDVDKSEFRQVVQNLHTPIHGVSVEAGKGCPVQENGSVSNV